MKKFEKELYSVDIQRFYNKKQKNCIFQEVKIYKVNKHRLEQRTFNSEGAHKNNQIMFNQI
jgi:hypothetical protein